MNRIDNKIALITGGAQGIGAAECKLFVEAGAHVIITDINAEAGNSMAEAIGTKCQFLQHDVTCQSSWSKVVNEIEQTYGTIDILVNNAGIFLVKGLLETSLDEWNELIAINQTGTFLGLQSVLPIMQRQGKGSIINLSSITGISGAHRCPAYATTKWAVRGLTKSVALEFASTGIRINSVHPGLIATQMMEEFHETLDELKDRVPCGRLGTVEEVAQLVLFLASDDSSYCTGHEFVVDGALKA